MFGEILLGATIDKVISAGFSGECKRILIFEPTLQTKKALEVTKKQGINELKVF